MCDVFLSRVLGQTSAYVDCLSRILLCVGGIKGRRRHDLKVFVDQHGLELGSEKIPPDVVEHAAWNCRIGGHLYQTDL
jgi:hypothetical protein